MSRVIFEDQRPGLVFDTGRADIACFLGLARLATGTEVPPAVIEWLKEEGPGYQTKANQLLRGEMLRFFKRRKTAQRASGTQAKAQRKPARSR